MDSTVSSTMLQSSDMDTVMHGTEHDSNDHVQNGFMDPRVLNQYDEFDTTSSGAEPASRAQSQPSSHETRSIVLPRQAFLPTGVCYDDRMKLHANADFSAHPHHPEDPRRIESIMREFKEAGLVYQGSAMDLEEQLRISPNRWMWRISARKATEAEICTAHTAMHYQWVQHLSQLSSADLRALTTEFDEGRKSLYVGSLTFEAALISAGGAIETCKNVVAGRVRNAIAVIRPPGHHAEHNESLGFCIFNNVPIAAKICMADYPDVCRKVLIVDWDVHHGNGIQNIFYEDPNVLYISLHVYGNGEFYPGQPEHPGIPDGGLDKCGAGRGVGKNINIGWAEQGVGDGEYMAAFQRIIMPIAQEFDPDLVIVASGFDAASGDELGGCFVTPPCYSHMTHMLMSLAGGKVAVCLEGGYNLKAISVSALAVAKTLMGEPPERMKIPPLNKQAAHTLDNVQRIQASYWNCMRPGVVPVQDLQERGTHRISDVIRLAQKSLLGDKYNMIPLFVQRNKLNRSFENQVLVTPEMQKAKRILVVIHDPPEVLAQPDPYDNTVYAHNAFVTDALLPYIDWAIRNDFGIVDINIPQNKPSDSPDSDPYTNKMDETHLQIETKELLCYLWDNYFETNVEGCITLMGVGDAYLGVKQLLTSRDCRQKIPSILSFVSGSLRPVRSEIDAALSTWYKTNSLIYVSPDHACWRDEESAKKVKKNRFGRVVRADIEVHGGGDGWGTGGNGGGGVMGGVVGKMMKRYEKESTTYILTKVQQWEEENGDPDETEDEDEKEGSDSNRGMGIGMGGENGDEELGISGVQSQRSVRVPVGMGVTGTGRAGGVWSE